MTHDPAPIQTYNSRLLGRLRERLIQRKLDGAGSEGAREALRMKYALPPWANGVKLVTQSHGTGRRKRHVLMATERRGH